MKKSIALGALVLLLLTGCGSGESPAAEYDVTAASQALLDSGGFSQALEALDADMVSAYYGLDSDPAEAAVYTSLEGGYEELAVLKLADQDAADAAYKALGEHVAAQTETERDVQYQPSDLPKLEKAVVRQSGKTVLLVVADDYEKVQSALDSLEQS